MSMKIIVGVEGEGEGREAVVLGSTLARALRASVVLAGVYSILWSPAAYSYEIAGRDATASTPSSGRTARSSPAASAAGCSSHAPWSPTRAS
jgi:hypothetical protein